MMIHSSNYPLQHQALLSCLWYIGTQWWESKGKFKQWILYRLDSEVLHLVGAGFNRRKNSLDKEILCPWIISSEGIIWHFVCTVCSSTEQARGHQHLWVKLPPCYLPVPKAFDVWVTEGSLQLWGSKGGTSWGSKPFSEPSINDRQNLDNHQQQLSCTQVDWAAGCLSQHAPFDCFQLSWGNESFTCLFWVWNTSFLSPHYRGCCLCLCQTSNPK